MEFVLGPAGSGKTSYCIRKARELVQQGKEVVFLVPENMDFTFEKELLRWFEPKERNYCTVTNFKKCCREIFALQGGAARIFLDDAEKYAMIRKTLLANADQLSFYRRKSKDRAFYEMLGQLFDELRNACVTPGELRDLQKDCGTDASKQKFGEIAGLLETYETLLSSSYFDDAQELEHAQKLCAASGLFAGKTVFLEQFNGFTSPQLHLISQISASAEQVYCSLTCTGSVKDEETAFGGPYRALCRLEQQEVARTGQTPRRTILSRNDREAAAGINELERYLSGTKLEEAGSDGVFLIRGSDLYDEVARVADEMVRLTREEGYQYRDMVVMARDVNRYEEVIQHVFQQFELPFLMDQGETLINAPGVVFLLAVLEHRKRYRTDSILRMLKTGLTTLAEEEIALLENYVYIHDIDGDGWEQPFDENPEGLGEMGTEERNTLALVESCRQQVVAWLGPYLATPHRQGAKWIRDAYGVLQRCGGVQAVEEQHAPGRRDAQLFFGMLDRFAMLLGEEEYSAEEMMDLLRVMAASTKALQIPETVDAVLIGEAQRTIPFNPKIAFVLGLNDGLFPKDEFSGNLFTLEERDLLYAHDFYVSGAFEECVDLERLYLYQAVTAPTQRLYLSYAAQDLSGASMDLCTEIQTMVDGWKLQPIEATDESFVVNASTARSAYARAYSSRKQVLLEALKQSEAKEEVQRLEKQLEEKSLDIDSPELARKLVGSHIQLSASKIDAYERCPFRFFARYLLRAKPIEPIQISPAEAGSFVHDVMENLFRELNGDLTSISPAELVLACNRLADVYMDGRIPPEKRTFRIQALVDQIKEAAGRLALQLQMEQEQSEFRASDFELNIAENSDVPSPSFELESGDDVYLEGKVDRVDVYERDGVKYLRIVDYKTGTKEFDLNNILYGLDIQMMLYLFALKNQGEAHFKSPLGLAGVLYLPSDPGPKSEAKAEESGFKMNGLLVNDDDILHAMERDGKGVFIPVKLSQKGGWKGSGLESLENFGKIERRIRELIVDMGNQLQGGKVAPNPAEAKDVMKETCKYCDYKGMCNRERVKTVRKIEKDGKKKFLGEQSE